MGLYCYRTANEVVFIKTTTTNKQTIIKTKITKNKKQNKTKTKQTNDKKTRNTFNNLKWNVFLRHTVYQKQSYIMANTFVSIIEVIIYILGPTVYVVE